MEHETILRYTWDRVQEMTSEGKLSKHDIDFFKGVLEETWDCVNPHNAMELADGIARQFPKHDARTIILHALDAWETKENFKKECSKNSAKGCLEKALNEIGFGRRFPKGPV